MVIANWRAVGLFIYLLESPDSLSVASQLFAWRTWSCHTDITAHHIGQTHTQHVRICAGTSTNIKGFEQDVEDPCVDMSQV
jgi:hypothetical protein